MTITLELTQGQVAIIDDEDGDLAMLKWTAKAAHGISYYAIRWVATPKQTTIYLHRVILERVTGRPLTKTELTDHISGDKLDNRRENLRIATPSQNQQNRGTQRNNTSGYKGVTWDRRERKWLARIEINGKRMYLGHFTTPEAAYQNYCAAADELHGEFANKGSK